MKLTKRQLRLAVEIYSLAILSGTDGNGVESETEWLVMDATSASANELFFKKFPDESVIPETIKDCINMAIRLTKG